ncbi:hypothetical protein LC613_33510 [Nostoc sphaeroides CHAB 2801]|uniref:hypothetical protein n=1 Tax=Nostoc sphaeroides TaxID=446679 RepID=UPI001E3A188D|nr:hypothetical protein [Nostoc sphaeroides]MCC5632532.1 hypothetical protein [Nostoc sphaeroides CHAB 2801]
MRNVDGFHSIKAIPLNQHTIHDRNLPLRKLRYQLLITICFPRIIIPTREQVLKPRIRSNA